MPTKIVQKEDPVLRKKAKEVPVSEIKSEKTKKIIKDMKSALKKEGDGVAIAAPQIGESVRIFVLSDRMYGNFFGETGVEKTEGLVYINPKIIKKSKKEKLMFEGCLSVRPLWGHVKRSTQVTVEAYSENGEKFTRGAGGILAHIFQHEIEHLDGILFIDKCKDIKTLEEHDLAD